MNGPAAAAAEREAQGERQRAWLKRGLPGNESAKNWQPRKRFRMASRRWLLLLDNAVRSVLPHNPPHPRTSFGLILPFGGDSGEGGLQRVVSLI